jgi:hypothetical protein
MPQKACLPHQGLAQQPTCHRPRAARASQSHVPLWSPRAGHRPSAASSPPCCIPFLPHSRRHAHRLSIKFVRAHATWSRRPQGGQPRPPIIPVIGRRMVMNGYARRQITRLFCPPHAERPRRDARAGPSLVEVAGIEPASFRTSLVLLRAQPAVLFSAPAITQASRRRAQPLLNVLACPVAGPASEALSLMPGTGPKALPG